MSFIRTESQLLAREHIARVDYSRIEQLILIVHCKDGSEHAITGILALEAAMLLSPALLEGKRLRWAKHRWAVHNLIGHPLMQVLAWARRYDWAMKVHDRTIPRPLGSRE
ncbi:MAG TPA: hypothetical protein VM869_20105 [Enhygromyxa sp.]|nr:hypothetical protein [Enhygromyxa sp.]